MPQAAAPYEREDFRRIAGETLRPGGLALTERALAACRFPSRARILDLGCGPGATLSRLREADLCAVGLDASSLFAAEAAAIAPALQGRGQALPFRDGCLDGVFCECVLSASGDAEACLTEIARVLRPGGMLMLSDLYLRQGDAPAAGLGCVAGAVTPEAQTQRLIAAGLTPLLFEDHSRLLTELACRLTMALGSAKSVIALITGRDPACQSLGPRPKFGYGLILAAKESP